MKDKRILVTAGIMIVSVGLTILSYFVLPDRVVLQITLSGEAGNTVPKVVGLLIPFALSVVFSILHHTTKRRKYLVVALVGAVLPLLLMLIN